MKTEIVNLTPHEIIVGTQTIPASGTVARVVTTSKAVGHAGGIPLTVTETGPVKDLPDPSRGVLYVVSALVRIAYPERNDIASPGQLVRDDNGRVIGCESLIVNDC